MKKMLVLTLFLFMLSPTKSLSSLYGETKFFQAELQRKHPQLNELELKRKVIELLYEVIDLSELKIDANKKAVFTYNRLNFGLAPEGFLFGKDANLKPHEIKFHGNKLFLHALYYILLERTIIQDQSDIYDEQKEPEIPQVAFALLEDEDYLTWKESQHRILDLHSMSGQKALIDKLLVDPLELLVTPKREKEAIFAYNALRDIHNKNRITSLSEISEVWLKTITPTKAQIFTELVNRYQVIPVGLGLLSSLLLYLHIKKATPPNIVYVPQYIRIPTTVVYNTLTQISTRITQVITYRMHPHNA